MTDSVVTFEDKNKLFRLTVKSTFLEKCANPGDHDMDTLSEDFKFQEFLHAPFGPAIEVLIPGREKEIFIIEGKHVRDQAVIDNIKTKKQFNTNFDELIK